MTGKKPMVSGAVGDSNSKAADHTMRVRSHATLKKAGGSLVMTVPAPVRKALGLTEGTEMVVSIEGSRVVMEPVTGSVRARRPKYSLEELLAGYNPDAPLSDEERAWHDAEPAGREIW